MQNFPKKTTIYNPLITHNISKYPCTKAYQGVRNVRFLGKFGMLCFLETPVLRFAFLPYYQQYLFSHPTSNRLKQTKVSHMFFLFSLKRSDSQIFKSSSCKNYLLQSVSFWYDLLRCFLFHVITGRYYFS